MGVKDALAEKTGNKGERLMRILSSLSQMI